MQEQCCPSLPTLSTGNTALVSASSDVHGVRESHPRHHSFFSVKAVIQSLVKRSTTSGLRMSFRNCSCWTRSKALSVGPGYLKFSLAWRGANKLLHKGGDATYDRKGRYLGSAKYLRYLHHSTKESSSKNFWTQRWCR